MTLKEQGRRKEGHLMDISVTRQLRRPRQRPAVGTSEAVGTCNCAAELFYIVKSNVFTSA